MAADREALERDAEACIEICLLAAGHVSRLPGRGRGCRKAVVSSVSEGAREPTS
jgi:hypothetical protein